MSLRIEKPGAGALTGAVQAARMETLKILIASTPKTGNTWLKYLLSEIYELPIADLPPNFRDGVRGQRWVGHQHYLPESELLEWVRREGVICVTTVRHPGDVLVSLRHYLETENAVATSDRDPASMLEDGPGFFGERTRRYVRDAFFILLHLSIAWGRGGWSRVVRYEDLWCDPVKSLKELTDQIIPVPEERIRAAVRTCGLDRMRRRFPGEKRFYRKGGTGDWRGVLSPEIRHAFERDPYPAQFAAFGYEPLGNGHRSADPLLELRRRWRAIRSLPLVIAIWRKLSVWRQTRWLDAARGSATVLGWLNRPAAEDERNGGRFPLITKLALGLYLREPRMAKHYADPLGRNRVEFANWFLVFGPKHFHLDRSFLVPMLHAWTDRSPRPCPREI